MICERFRAELGGYVLDGLEPEERDAVRAHLEHCDRCRAEVGDLAELPDLLAEAWTAPPRAPADLRARVLGRFGVRTRRVRRVPALLAAALMAVAALAGGAVVAVLDRPPPPDTVLTLHQDPQGGPFGEAALTQVDAGVRIDLELAGVQGVGEGYYHAWLHRGDARVSGGTFIGTTDGEVAVRLLCGGLLEDYERLTVTWHPFDGSGEVIAVDAAFGTDVERSTEDPW